MKRILLVAVSSSALALAAPAIASAQHHGKHHSGKHHAARARVLDFRALAAATPATPASPGTESAGKVTSFKEGVLTITLTDGTVVSGKVTEQTEIGCTSATSAAGGDDNDDEGDSGEGVASSTEGFGGDAHAASSGDDAQDGSDEGQQSCTTAAVVPGAMVREAELILGSAGAVWEKVDLS
jgi:hypothetical protein